MPIANSLRKVLDRKQWEPVNPAPLASAAAHFVIGSSLTNRQLIVTSASVIYWNDPDEDASMQIPASGLTGTFGAGSCGVHHPAGPTGTISAATSLSITTNLNLPANHGARNFTVRITGGTGAGQERVVTNNTIGASGVLTVSVAWTINPDATSTFQLMSGRYWIWNAGTGSTFGFRHYDVATGAWSAELTKAAVGATWGTDGRLVSHWTGPLFTGTASAGAGSTLTDGTKSWATNQWANFQVRITGGTGRGQVRRIASNTGTVLTVASAWTTNPDATSTYTLEGDENALYLMGNNAIALYKYDIAANTWATLSPGVARAAAPGSGMWAGVPTGSTAPDWNTEAANLNGRRMYSLRGGGSSALDYYDIAANTWVNAVAYLRAQETFTTGTGYALVGDKLYIHKEATGRWFRLDLARQLIDPWSTLIYPQGAALVGERVFTAEVVDGGTTLTWIYVWTNSQVFIFRQLVI